MARMRKIIVLVLFVAATFACAQTDASKTPPPVIDIHVHAMDGIPGVPPLCPWPPQFLASDPKSKEAPFGGSHQACSPALDVPKNPADYMKELLAEWEKYNVTAVVMGDPKSVKKWKDAAPDRVIMGTSFDNGPTESKFIPVDQLRTSFTQDGFKIMGEIGLQYQGMSPSDMSVDQYFALAEELDIPVGIHMGTGGSGRANIGMPKFRGSMGNPLLLEELLARHPKLRLWIMHAATP